jgi:hypothetical protein
MRRRAPGYKRPPTPAAWKRQVREAQERGDTAKLAHLMMSRPPGVEDDAEVAAGERVTRIIETTGGHRAWGHPRERG